MSAYITDSDSDSEDLRKYTGSRWLARPWLCMACKSPSPNKGWYSRCVHCKAAFETYSKIAHLATPDPYGGAKNMNVNHNDNENSDSDNPIELPCRKTEPAPEPVRVKPAAVTVAARQPMQPQAARQPLQPQVHTHNRLDRPPPPTIIIRVCRRRQPRIRVRRRTRRCPARFGLWLLTTHRAARRESNLPRNAYHVNKQFYRWCL